MTDYFALLGETRRPWLDTEALKAKFLTLTASVHPDRVHNATPTEKQIAYLARLGWGGSVPETRATASDLIDRLMAAMG